MVQYLNATADLHVGSWTTHTGATTNLWQQLDDVVPEEADYVQSEISPAGSVYVVALSEVTDPESSEGHIFRWMHRNPEDGDLDLTVELRQGYASEASQGTLIVSWPVTGVPGAFTTVSQTLTGPQADSITDYGALSLRFVATEA